MNLAQGEMCAPSHINKKCLVFLINSEPIMAMAYSKWPASCATSSCSLHFVLRHEQPKGVL